MQKKLEDVTRHISGKGSEISAQWIITRVVPSGIGRS